MGRWIIKDMAYATEQNPSFEKGTESIHYIGKSGYVKDDPAYLLDDHWQKVAYAERKAVEYTKDHEENFKRYPYWNTRFVVVDMDKEIQRLHPDR